MLNNQIDFIGLFVVCKKRERKKKILYQILIDKIIK